jgi:excisionase family DNA binding protein
VSVSELMTVEKAADYLGVSRATVYRWMAKGLITYYAVGSVRRRFRREDLDAAYLRVEAGRRPADTGHAEPSPSK